MARFLWLRLRGTIARRLLIPMRSHHPPEYTARGVFVGLLVALTPTLGIQMAIVAAVWALVRALRPRYDFSLIVALAWTWVTNALTAPLVYYAYIVTGRILLGRWDELRGYDTFTARLQESLEPGSGWLETTWVYFTNLLVKFGVPMFVGSIPWTLLGAWLGYRWSLRITRAYQHRRARRRARVAGTRES